MKKTSIKKILVANRGEIAVRIMRSAKELGIKTVAVYSDIDKNCLHVKYADESYHIGPAPANSSYLDQKKIIKACKESGADAIHPGYGFLSENPSFASLVESENINFIGPAPTTIDTMGNKLKAKKLAKEHSIPLVPGSEEPISDIKVASEIANNIGFPILIKASAGGGGKGMRIVREEKQLIENLERAMSEAQSSFGDSSVFIEKFIDEPRHIEFQILADNHGNVIHLFERECSVQRRYQKVIEEAPSCFLTPELRDEMGECAKRIAKACNYRGAGTVEFIMNSDLEYFFLEMNTRLQVEHPITELISNVDLVKEQIYIANGEQLKIKQSDLNIKGHAIELRVYAEDPENNFLPDTGRITHYELPKLNNVRVDHGTQLHDKIGVYYDPMISKLVVHAESRSEAIELMEEAIQRYRINGVVTTLTFGSFVMGNKVFKSGTYNTNFIAEHFNVVENISNYESEILYSTIDAFSKGLQRDRTISKKESKWALRRKA